jgi:metal-sulfur cluster biosynthetic enzyme
MAGSPYTASRFAPPPPPGPRPEPAAEAGEPAPPGEAAASASGDAGGAAPASAAQVEEALRDVIDPELGINVVDLGLLYGVSLDGRGWATVDMTLTSAACPLTDLIESQAAAALEGLVAGVEINWVWTPPWGPDRITPDGREQLRALGFNV